MEDITGNYLTRAELWLLITILTYFLMNGAQVFETAVIIPKWTASPPDSFQMLGGKYGLDLKTFWIVLHSIHEVTFIIAILFCWKIEPVRNWLLILFALHFAVRVWTIGYFAPNIIEFQEIANTPKNIQGLVPKTSLWKLLNYVRVGIFILVSIGLVPILLRVINLRASIPQP